MKANNQESPAPLPRRVSASPQAAPIAARLTGRDETATLRSMVHCTQCGSPTQPNAAACSVCGFALVRPHAPLQGGPPQSGPPTAPGGIAVPQTAPGAMAAPPFVPGPMVPLPTTVTGTMVITRPSPGSPLVAPGGPAAPAPPLQTRTVVGMSPVRPMVAEISGGPAGRPPRTIVGMPATAMPPVPPRLQEQGDPGNA